MDWCSVILCVLTMFFFFFPVLGRTEEGALYLQVGICLCLPGRTSELVGIDCFLKAGMAEGYISPCAPISSN